MYKYLAIKVKIQKIKEKTNALTIIAQSEPPATKILLATDTVADIL